MEAIRPCPEEQEGFIRRKCEKTNNRTRGYWPSHSNPENCVQREIFLTRDKVSKVTLGRATLWGIRSVVMFCFVFYLNFQLPIGLHISYATVSARGRWNLSKMLSKHLD